MLQEVDGNSSVILLPYIFSRLTDQGGPTFKTPKIINLTLQIFFKFKFATQHSQSPITLLLTAVSSDVSYRKIFDFFPPDN